jgi:hypothetical protein
VAVPALLDAMEEEEDFACRCNLWMTLRRIAPEAVPAGWQP